MRFDRLYIDSNYGRFHSILKCYTRWIQQIAKNEISSKNRIGPNFQNEFVPQNTKESNFFESVRGGGYFYIRVSSKIPRLVAFIITLNFFFELDLHWSTWDHTPTTAPALPYPLELRNIQSAGLQYDNYHYSHVRVRACP